MKVMKEIEQMKQSDAVKTARERMTGEGTETTPPDAPPKGTGLDASSIEQMIHGKVVSWNSLTAEITCTYDFDTKEQFMDWEGSTTDDLRKRLVCDKKQARFLPAFKSIAKIEYQGYLYSGPGGVRLTLGNSLTAEVGYGDNHGNIVLFQDNEHYPIIKFDRDIEAYKKYDVVLSLQADKVVWDIDGKNVASVPLQRPLQYPLQIGFGRDGNLSMVDNVTITGILSMGQVKAMTE